MPAWESNVRHLVFLLAIAFVSSSHATEIVWDSSTLTLVQRGAAYGRMIRLSSGEILCCFTYSRKAWVRTSTDNGKTWQPMVLVARYPYGHAVNPEIIQLTNCNVLCFYNERPRNRKLPYAIRATSSVDRGRTWSAAKQLYRAGTEFENGCWEPAAVQLPGGELQVFFANEGPYRSTEEQEITLMRSFDNGSSWGKPARISFRAGHRDGMPVPLLLRDNKGLVVAIEDNGVHGKFKPVILHTSMKDNWAKGCIDGDSPRRRSALKTDLRAEVCAGAPYICQLPSAATVLSVQSDEGARKEPQMVVYLGDGDARNFGGGSVPFKIGPETRGVWNSLFVKDRNTVTAISSTTMRNVPGLWAIDGHVKSPEK